MPQPPERLIHGDAGQPGGEAGLAAVLCKMRERGNVGLLHGIFGFRVVSQHTSGNPIETAVVSLHNRTKGIGISREYAPHEFRVVRSGSSRPLGLELGHGFFLSSLLDAFAGKRFPGYLLTKASGEI